MRRHLAFGAITAMTLLAACGQQTGDEDDADSGDRPEATAEATETDGPEDVPARAEGLDLCAMVDESTWSQIFDDFGTDDFGNAPRETPLRIAESFLSCTVGGLGAPNLAWGVREDDLIAAPDAEELLGLWSQTGDLTEIDLDGVPAQIAAGTQPGGVDDDRHQFRVAFEVDGLSVFVDARDFAPDQADSARDLVIDAATQVSAAMDGTVPTRIDTLDECPAPDHPALVEAMEGPALLARSRVLQTPGESVAWECHYVNEHTSAVVSRRVRAAAHAPISDPTPGADQPIADVQGHPALLRGAAMEGRITVDGDCLFETTFSPVGPHDWSDFPLFPTEEGIQLPPDSSGFEYSEVDEVRDAKSVLLLEAVLDAAPCPEPAG